MEPLADVDRMEMVMNGAMRGWTRVIQRVAMVAMAVGATASAHAQEQAADWSRVQPLIQSADTLIVTDSMGRLFRSQAGTLSLATVIERAGISPADVRTIAVERRDSVWNGTLIGLAIAGTPWLITCAINDWCYYNEYGSENLLRTTALTTTAIGAGLGALVDLSKKTRITLYESSGARPMALKIAPSFSKSGLGIGFSVKF